MAVVRAYTQAFSNQILLLHPYTHIVEKTAVSPPFYNNVFRV
jgi:hypothetical protein